MSNVLFTTTSFRRDTRSGAVRIGLAHRLVKEAIQEGFTVVVLDQGSADDDLTPLRESGANILKQESVCSGGEFCMGKSRREALNLALKYATNPSDFLIWTEPEKYPLVPDLAPAIDRGIREGSKMIMFNRERARMDSYPPEQAHAYEIVRLAATYMIGQDLDFMFGPVAFQKELAFHWLNYQGEQWDCIHIPKLRAIRQGVKYTVFPTQYSHPKDQTASEVGDMKLLVKRITQASVVVKLMVKEFEAKA